MAEEGVVAPEGPANPIETDYTVGQDNVHARFGPFKLEVHDPVFLVSGLSVVAFVVLALALPDTAEAFFGWLRPALTSTFDGFFLIAGDIFVILALVLVVSPLGKVRIGGMDAEPDYGYATWFSMLFAAGMGIGLMFFGVAEPVSHYTASLAQNAGSPESLAPLGGAPGNEADARHLGIAATIYHYALHPWAIYGVVGLSLAIFAYNKGLPLSMRSIFYPIFGERVWGWTGHIVDILAVFATLFGLATSLGIGAQQANAGLGFLFGVPIGDTSQVLLVVGITAITLISVAAGLNAGLRRVSVVNMILAALLLLFVFVAGPTTTLLMGFFTNLVAYIEYLPALSTPFLRDDANFSANWTSFYWAWWISWSPFVGMFIARISRGRTVREFIICVLLIPSAVAVIWMTTYGGTAITMLNDGYQAIAEAPLELQLFTMLDNLPLAGITSFVGIILVVLFFVTSSDSGSLVVDIITAGGKVNAPVLQRVFWASFEGLIAIALLVGGGLAALQTASLSTGLPFAIVLLLGCVALVMGLLSEPRGRRAAAGPRRPRHKRSA